MSERLRWLGQAVAYALFIAFVGYFSNSPSYRHLPEGMSTIKLSVRHSGKLLGECHTLDAAELANLPATMRAAQSCPRERSPLLLELEVNDKTVLSRSMEPRGLHDDGMASMYQRLTIPSGDIDVKIRLKDHIGQEDFPYRAERRIHLAPAQVLVIDFDSQKSEFVFM